MNVYEMVTDRIIKELEAGSIPWQKPWTGTRSGAYSRSTGRAYSFINQMLLKHVGEYLTFKQVQEAGGKVRKGEKSEMVVFFKPYKITENTPDGKDVEKTIPLLRYYNVFHISQCEGLEAKYKPEDVKEFGPIAEAEAIASEYFDREGVGFKQEAGDRAYYTPLLDMIVLPLKEQFDSVGEYYSTLFHEITHSTGHKSRLGRIVETAHKGGEEYSKEELVAEIGAAAIMSHLGIENAKTFKNSAAYVQSWIKALKNDVRMIVSASSKAEKAVNLVLGLEV